MDFESFTEGSLLWVIFLIFSIAVIARFSFFIAAVIRSSKDKEAKIGYDLAIIGRFFGPFHMGIAKRPIYALLRYIFHICLVVVPVWLGGHVVLWSESRLEWDWLSLPDTWADGMTLVLLALAVYFFARRIFSRDVRSNSFPRDFLIIFFTALPFITGYFLTHGNVDQVAFLGDHIRTFHVLSGEAMILMAAFLFCRTWMNTRKCTGCAACELACPTGTLESRDEGKFRIFSYSHYQCICCASCVNTCPEGAAELRHEINAKRFLQVFSKREIRSVELEACERCGAYFAPESQMEKISLIFDSDCIKCCPNCRKAKLGERLHQMSPWHRRPKKPDETLKTVEH